MHRPIPKFMIHVPKNQVAGGELMILGIGIGFGMAMAIFRSVKPLFGGRRLRNALKLEAREDLTFGAPARAETKCPLAEIR